MAEFIRGTDYRQYLQNQSYVNDIRDAQTSAAQDTITAIGAGSRSILLGVADAQREAADLIASAQWDSARMTAAAMEHAGKCIVGAIGELDSTFRWGFGQVIASLGGMSTSLDALVQTAKTPAQTTAYEQFEIARDAFRKSLYAECLEALGKAISGDHTSPGYKLEWRFHHLVGAVRLGFPGCDLSLVDPAAAEQSFLLATRYARTDAPGEAARALFSAGWAAFVQNKLPDALQHTEGAIAIDGRFAEALFQAAKVRMAQGDPAAALPALRRAITLDRGYALRAAGDDVFRQHLRSVDEFLEALRIEKARTLQPIARARLAAIKALIVESAELAGHGTVHRLTKVAEEASILGLMDLLEFEKDAEGLNAFISLLGKLRKERRDISVERDVKEAYDIQETYSENVVIRRAGLFRKEQVEAVQRTRTIRKSRTVRLPVKEHRHVWADGFGHVIADVDGWILVMPGTFAMGSDSAPHDVTITRPFLMQATPVTQGQYRTITGKNPSRWTKNADHPVANMTWFDAIAYCNTLSRTEGLEEAYVMDGGSAVRWKGLDALGYRLPTDAEWEYACRAGITDDRLVELNPVDDWYKKETIHPVGQKLPNPWGFFDMFGNVFEWCWDWAGVPQEGAATDPVGPVDGKERRFRGGYGSYAFSQSSKEPGGVWSVLGFRPVRSCHNPLLHRQIEALRGL